MTRQKSSTGPTAKEGVVGPGPKEVPAPVVAPPDIERIETVDLRDDDRLKALYVEAVKRRYWPNTAPAALEFFAYAEKALQDDTRGTPGRLFYSLVKRKDGSTVTQAVEDRAMARCPSQLRQEMVDEAAFAIARKAVAALPSSSRDADGSIEDALVGRDNIGYAHAVMVQCFLPQHPFAGAHYETSHGRASLIVQAGPLANPDKQSEWIWCDVPSGSKPRLILPYIVGQAVRDRSPEIDLGDSMRKFMARIGMPVTGHNGKALTDQIRNLAAAQIVIGEWKDDAVHTHSGTIAKRVSFWLERDPNQATLWTPTMTLSEDFYATIQDHRVPIDIGHLAKFARSPRRMDLYAWLSYRTARIKPRHREPVSLQALWRIFAPDIARYWHFKNRIKGDLKAIRAVYAQFNVDIDGDILWLRRSPPPVPFKVSLALAKQTGTG